MKLMPKTLKIGGFIYDVIYPHKFETENNLLGLHEYQEIKIKVADEYIGKKLPWSRRHEILTHEILHAIDHVFSEGKLEEGDLSKLSVGLYQVLRDNNLNLKRDSWFPKYIKIGGFRYSIIPSHKFLDEVHVTYCYVSNLENKIMLSREGKSPFLKARLMESIFLALCSIYLTGDPANEYLMCSSNMVGNGLYQVIVENNIEDLINAGITEDNKRMV